MLAVADRAGPRAVARSRLEPVAPAGPPARRARSAGTAPFPDRTYRRRRAVAAGLVVVLVLAVWAALGALGGGPLPVPERSDRLQAGTEYTVQPGDTLWSIARRVQPAGDPRPLVDRLVSTHGGPTLYVGERLVLPRP